MRLLTLLSVVLVATTAAAGDCRIPTSDDAAEAVRRLNLEYIDAVRANDAAWFREHMANDVVIILGSGRRLNKSQFLAQLEDPREFRSLFVRDVTVRVYGATVQVNADAPWKLADGRKGVSRYIDTYAWLDCRWQVISAQITLLPEPSAT